MKASYFVVKRKPITILLPDGGILTVGKWAGGAITQPCDVVFIAAKLLCVLCSKMCILSLAKAVTHIIRDFLNVSNNCITNSKGNNIVSMEHQYYWNVAKMGIVLS